MPIYQNVPNTCTLKSMTNAYVTTCIYNYSNHIFLRSWKHLQRIILIWQSNFTIKIQTVYRTNIMSGDWLFLASKSLFLFSFFWKMCSKIKHILHITILLFQEYHRSKLDFNLIWLNIFYYVNKHNWIRQQALPLYHKPSSKRLHSKGHNL